MGKAVPRIAAIILTRTVNDEIFEMTKECARSLLEHRGAANAEIVVEIVESNRETPGSRFEYPSEYSISRPQEAFGFHRFLNIGIRKHLADYYLLCNNDLYFHENWLPPLLELMQREDIGSVSPMCPELAEQIRLRQATSTSHVVGYDVKQHISGWCIMVKASTLERIGGLDEEFDFYFADNDYSQELRRNNIRHALSFDSRVTHLEHKKQSNATPPQLQRDVHRTDVPRYLEHPRFSWILGSEKMLEGFMKFTRKWGDYRVIFLKRRLHDLLFLRLNIGIASRLLFTKRQCR